MDCIQMVDSNLSCSDNNFKVIYIMAWYRGTGKENHRSVFENIEYENWNIRADYKVGRRKDLHWTFCFDRSYCIRQKSEEDYFFTCKTSNNADFESSVISASLV